MGELSRARDAVFEAATDEARNEALDRYAEVVRDYLLTDIESAVEAMMVVESETARVVVAWVLDILAQFRR